MKTIEREKVVGGIRKLADKCKDDATAKKAAVGLRKFCGKYAVAYNLFYRGLDCLDAQKVRKVGKTLATIAKDPSNGLKRGPAYYEGEGESAALAVEASQSAAWVIATVSGAIATSVEEAEVIASWSLNTFGKVLNVIGDVIERAPSDSPDCSLAKICDVETEVFPYQFCKFKTDDDGMKTLAVTKEGRDIIRKSLEGIKYTLVCDSEDHKKQVLEAINKLNICKPEELNNITFTIVEEKPKE